MQGLRSKEKNMNIAVKVWNLMKPFHKYFYLILLVTTLFEGVRLFVPFFFGKILDLLDKTNGLISVQTGMYVIGGLAIVRLTSIIIDYLTEIVIVKLLWAAERHFSQVSFAKLLELSMDYHEKEKTGTKITLVNKGREKFLDLLIVYFFEFQPVVILLIGASIFITVTNWKMGLIFMVSVIPFILITLKTYQSTSTLRKKRHDAYEVSSGEIGDTITNITVVKAYAQEKREQESFTGLWNFIKEISKKEFTTHMWSGFGRNMLLEVFYVSMLVFGISQIVAGNLTVGSLVFIITLIERSYSNIYRLGRIYEQVMDAKEPVDRVTNLLQKGSTIKNSPNATILDKIKGKITFTHVTFAYNKKRVLRNVSFTIKEGSFTALVGKSGSGKSTIAKLLSRYYDPTSGQILIDGKFDLKKVDIDSFRKQTAVVFQDSPVPDRKIWEVISYSAGKADYLKVRKRVIEAATLAHAHEFILELDEGYQTKIGERGVKLSGGQKQRLAIARALFAQPKILIMDEPTSHLDTISEAKIQQALNEISKERAMTKIIIAHRLSTVQHADQILVMEKGRLVERGTHRQLLEKNGVYASIVHQSELKV